MTSDLTRPPEQRYGYSNAFTGLASLVKTEGPMGLVKGLGTNLVGHIWDFFAYLTSFRVDKSNYDECV